MMSSWITKFLSDDEYKQKQVLAFIAEGVVFQFLTVIIMAILYKQYEIDFLFVLGTPFLVFIFYVFGRYTLSGIEYTNIFTEEEYKAKRKHLLKGIPIFVLSFIILGLLFNIDTTLTDLIGIGAITGILTALFNLTSLRRSYNKNKDL
jgi:hypothetical protein